MEERWKRESNRRMERERRKRKTRGWREHEGRNKEDGRQMAATLVRKAGLETQRRATARHFK